MNFGGWHELFSLKAILSRLREENHRSVLIVEDDVFLKPVLARLLYSLDPSMSIHWSTTVEDARQALRENIPDAMLVDCLLGKGESGLELWHEVREEFPQVPFLMMSGLSDTTLRKMKSAADPEIPATIQKPFRLSDLRNRVRELLTLH
jgi:DNA-binding response OmpR family regulator